jgi:hypothetical protein
MDYFSRLLFCVLVALAWNVNNANAAYTSVGHLIETYKDVNGIHTAKTLMQSLTNDGPKRTRALVPASKATIGRLATLGRGGPYGAAIQALAIGVAWAWSDELLQYVQETPGASTSPTYADAWDICYVGQGTNFCYTVTTGYAGCQAFLGTAASTWGGEGYSYEYVDSAEPAWQGTCTYNQYLDGTYQSQKSQSVVWYQSAGQQPECPAGSSFDGTNCVEPTQTLPVPMQDIGEAIDNSTSVTPHQILSDAVDRGTWDNPDPEGVEAQAWPEMEQARQQVQTEIQREYEPQQGDPAADPETIQQTQTATNQITGCELLPAVCAIWDWLSGEPPTTDDTVLPEETVDANALIGSYSSGLGDGSCPSAIPVTGINGFSFNYEFTTACDAATTYVKPIVLFLASLSAAFILLGQRKTGEAA